jgi:hypothetical protein
MFRLFPLAAMGRDVAYRIWFEPRLRGWHARGSQARDSRTRARRRRFRLELERLEDRTLLSASIFGSVFNDLGGTGVFAPSDPGVPSQLVYLDLNHDGKLDSTTTTVPATSTTIDAGGAGNFASQGGFGSSLTVQNLPAKVLDVAISMDVTNSSPAPAQVVLMSPAGSLVPQIAYLFTLQPGQHFVGTFDGNSPNSVNLAGTTVPNGTYAPEEGFNNPQVLIENGNPNGAWSLAFVPFSGSPAGLTLNSWSLSITSPEPSTHTDAAGNYSFTGLAAGTYHVGLLHTSADVVTSGAAQTVSLADGQTATNVNFGVQPAADLTGVSFALASPASGWGQPVTIKYTLTNQGAGAAPAFDVGLYLSNNGVISTSGPLLDTLHFPGLAAGASTSGAVTVTLPGSSTSNPAGFGPVSASYVGFVIDPSGAVRDANRATDASNQGAGIDLALLGAPPANVAVAAGAGVQQAPSIAVDPTDASHLVSAYLDYSLLHTGYAGIGVAVSHDGGQTWAHTSVPLPAGFDQGAAAPTVAFDSNGNAYVSFMAATFQGSLPTLTNPDSTQRKFGFQSNNGIFVAESTKTSGNGGLSWGAPTAVVSNSYRGTNVPFEAYPDMAIDPTSGAIYVSWARFYPPGQFPGDPNSRSGSDVMFAVSNNGGTTFQTQMQNVAGTGPGTGLVSAIHDPNFGSGDGANYMNFPSVSVGAGGAVYVSTYTGGYFTVYYSTAGGVSTGTAGSLVSSFTAPNLLSNQGAPFDYFGYQTRTNPTLDGFRTVATREIAADPTHPGVLYAVAANTFNQSESQGGPAVDANGIVFAVSHDYGQSWTSDFTVGSNPSSLASLSAAQEATSQPVLNDDNGGQFPGFAASPQDQVTSGQGIPSISVNAQGIVTVIWYDTRSDPSGRRLEVWGTVSTDGGQHFSPNFQVTSASFDPNSGTFTDATGNTNHYFGDQIGVATAGNTAYAVWTDTRTGNQQVYLDKYALAPAPQAPVDRLGPNNTSATATDLGTVSAQRVVPKLTLPPGAADEWFKLKAGANGVISVSVTAASGGSNLHIQLTDANGNVLPATITDITDPTNGVIGEELTAPSTAGQTYLLHVSADAPTFTTYTLTASVLTADLGTQVQGTKLDTLTAAAQNVYRLAAGVTGTLQVTLNASAGVQGALSLAVLSADGQTVLASGPAAGAGAGASEQLRIPVTAGQAVLLEVSGVDASSQGDFTLHFTNLDQYEASGVPTLFFPTQGDPTSIAASKLQGANKPTDLLVTNTDAVDALFTLMGNGDGTFQPEEQSPVGPGLGGAFAAGNRQLVVADLTGSGTPDVVVPNFRSGEISVLLGNGDGSFQPERRFNGVTSPSSMVAGNFVTGDKNTDLIVLQEFTALAGTASAFAFLRGRGDGTFAPPVFYSTAFTAGATSMVVGDFTGDGNLDLIVFGGNAPQAELFKGNGDGTFQKGIVFATPENTRNAAAVDLNGDGKLDLVTTGTNSGNVYVMMGRGDGTFADVHAYTAMAPRPGDNVSVTGLAVVDFGSPPSAGSSVAGPRDGIPDIIVTATSRSGQGSPEVIMLPGLGGGQFGAPIILATVASAGQIATGDFTGRGTTDLAVADKGGVTVVYGQPITVTPNTTPEAARNLGSADHLQTQPQAIVTGNADAYYRYTVPTEAAAGAGAQVVDISAAFAYQSGAGLSLEALDAAGNPLPLSQVLQSTSGANGVRLRIEAPQGSVLLIHVFGIAGAGGTRGAGVVTLDVDSLPQVVSVQAESPLPGGPTTSIVITVQGDRLDPAAAQDPANYTITWAGPDGRAGTADDVVFHPSAAGLPVVYSDSVSLGVDSGLTYLTQSRQTITLLFAQPLPAGTYTVTLSPNIQAAPLSSGEAGELTGSAAFAGHPVVSAVNGTLTNGSRVLAANLVAASGSPGNLNTLSAGTAFLTEYHDDAGTVLDSLVASSGDSPTITAQLNQLILAFFGAGVANGSVPVAIFWFDPVSIDLADSQGARTTYDVASNTVSNTSSRTYMETGGSIEVMVLAGVTGNLAISIADVQATARGGAVIFDGGQVQSVAMTDAIRGGARDFEFEIPSGGTVASTASTSSESAAGSALNAPSISVPLVTLTAAATAAAVGATGITSLGGPAPAGGQSATVGATATGTAPFIAVADGTFTTAALEQALDNWVEVVENVPGFGSPILAGVMRSLMRTTRDGRLEVRQPRRIVPADRDVPVRPAAPTPRDTPVRPAAPGPEDGASEAPQAGRVAPEVVEPVVLELAAAPAGAAFDEQAPAVVAVAETVPPRLELSAAVGAALVALGVHEAIYFEAIEPGEIDRARRRRP